MSALTAKLLENSIILKVQKELSNHNLASDKCVAEMLIHEQKTSKNENEFENKLKVFQFPKSFIQTLWRIIYKMTPKNNVINLIKSSNNNINDTNNDTNNDNNNDNRHNNDKRNKISVESPKISSHKHKKGKRSKHDSEDYSRKHKRMKYTDPYILDDKAIKYKIYDGIVDSVREFGCFVKLYGIKNKPTGLIRRDCITSDTSKPDPSNYVKRGQKVKVKVLTIVGDKIALSLKCVDQKTGKDLAPRQANDNEYIKSSNNGSIKSSYTKNDDEIKSRKRRISSPERWELSQLKAAGVYDYKYDPSYDDDHDILNNDCEAEEELDIELNDNEPIFLKGHNIKYRLNNDNNNNSNIDDDNELDSIKVIKNPDGSLASAALLSSALSKERREMREQKMKQQTDSIPADLSKNWSDPFAQINDRVFAQQLIHMGQKQKELPHWKKAISGRNYALGMIRDTPISQQRKKLPIYTLKNDLMKAIKENDILVCIGQTGSGKTTQITQYLAEYGYTTYGIIGCTQPRRVAAMSVAQRVAEEYGCRIGQEIGYCIRFEDCTSPSTIIKYMTDGMLLRECLIDINLKKYSVIMLDEAHERTIYTDVLFALLKQCLYRRNNNLNKYKPFKLLITSATLDAEKFSEYFNNCKIYTIPGRLHPVNILYSRKPESDYLEAALITVLNIHFSEPPGDILVFLTGKEEIDTACQILFERTQSLKGCPPLIILPVYSALPSEMQTRIFEPAKEGTRKIIIATNIAEASLTIDGIYYVIDPGFVKQQVYNPKLRMDSLVITPISQNSANQRAGRAGRTGPGNCYRLYTQNAYKNEMLKSSIPEIQRTNLGTTVLTLKAMGINDLLNFDFMDSPKPSTLINALSNLYNLNALDDEGLLTKLGRKMAEFPLNPELSKMLIKSVELQCSNEILTIVSMLQSDNIWFRPRDKQAIADSKRAKFFNKQGDHITLLKVFNDWKKSKFSNTWCINNFIQSRNMRHCLDVRKQLIIIMNRYNLDIITCLYNDIIKDNDNNSFIKIRKAITSGYFMHSAKKDANDGYKTLVESQPAYIHPSSSLFNNQPDWLIFNNLVLTSKEYLRECLVIKPQWLIQMAPRFFKIADPIKLSKRKRREKIEPLYDRYSEPNSWRLSRRRY